jgi:hypothetical protein
VLRTTFRVCLSPSTAIPAHLGLLLRGLWDPFYYFKEGLTLAWRNLTPDELFKPA